MTHSQRLREIANTLDDVGLDQLSPTLAEKLYRAASDIRAAADWADRVPHEDYCGVTLPRVGACTCLLSEPAP